MEEKLDILINIMQEQLKVQREIEYNLKLIRGDMPSEVSTSKLERLLEKIGDVVVNLER